MAHVTTGGILITTLQLVDPAYAASIGLRSQEVGCIPSGERLERIAQMIDNGKIRVNIGTVLTIEDVQKGQELNKAGKAGGKIVLTLR